MEETLRNEKDAAHIAASRKKKWRNVREHIGIGAGTLVLLFFAVLFLMPIILTITNSFMSASEINANYGAVFATTESGKMQLE